MLLVWIVEGLTIQAVLAPMLAKRLLGNAPVVGPRAGRVYLTRLLLDRDER